MTKLSRKDVRKYFKDTQEYYKSQGYDLSNMSLKFSKYPVYNNETY